MMRRTDGSVSVLIVDPDRDYAEVIRATLARDIYDVHISETIASAIGELRERPPEMVILDYGLEGHPSAVDFANAIRRVEPEMAVIFTSQSRRPVAEVVRCFRSGADEYIEKPFHPGELSARIGAVIRRTRGERVSDALTSDPPTAVDATLEVDLAARVASYGGRTLELTDAEFTVLAELHEAVGSIVSYERLTGRVLGACRDGQPHPLKVYVASLRQKLRIAGAHPGILRTAPRVGYALSQ